MEKYNPKNIEPKWQQRWAQSGIYNTKDSAEGKENHMLLTEFPYPSGNLHIGHWFAFAVPDILARFLRLKGKNVMYPMGFDAFGLPAENAAIKRGLNPREWTEQNISRMTDQFATMGGSFDWSRRVSTIDPEYYKWTQWIFLKMFKKGLAYRAATTVNWCPSCKTVLANEQVTNNGRCERCDAQVIQKKMEQWLYRITDYADRLIDDMENLDWPESTKIAQRNWIGRSVGAEFELRIANCELGIRVFTTRLDTVFGVTYAVVAPEHPIVEKLKDKIENQEEVEKYIAEAKKKTELQRTMIAEAPTLRQQDLSKVGAPTAERVGEKTGVEIKGIKAVNPFTDEEVPIFVADYVLATYGTGAVMAVPAHDERDFEFAKKYNLPVKQVIQNINSNAFIVHGSPREDKSKSPDFIPENIKHWLGWVKKELESNGYKVFNPRMPKSWQPDYKEWKKEFEKNIVNENSILVGHSAGGAFLVRWLGETKKRIKKFILVAPGRKLTEENTRLKKMYDFDLDKSVGDRVGEIIIFVSNENKPYKIENSKSYARDLKGKLIELESRGHFTLKDNKINKEFPELLEEILKLDCFTEDGILMNSGEYSGLTSAEAREKMAAWIEKNNFGKKEKKFRLHDWVISRQRYWGVPIPVVYCQHCAKNFPKARPSDQGSTFPFPDSSSGNSSRSNLYAIIPVPEKELPVELPELKDFLPTGDGKSPLAKAEAWVNVKCPQCGLDAKRETDTMDTFVDSSWYFIRYADPKNEKEFADKEKMKKWLPVPLYIGGAEHNTMHLLYSRFFTKVLHDLGLVHFSEPFTGRRNHGIILGPDNQKMSKSRGNVVDPDEEVKKYGADAVRMYLAFMGPYDQNASWQMQGVTGTRRFLEKVWKLGMRIVANDEKRMDANNKLESLLHKTIKKVTEDIDNLRFNTAISAMMILVNEMEKEKNIPITNYRLLITLLSPFAPHIAEEIWSSFAEASEDKEKSKYSKSIFFQSWPEYDPKLIKDEEISLVIQINGKLRDQIKVPAGIGEEEAKKLALESVKVIKYTEGKEIRKTIFVKDRLINLVI